MSFTKLFDCSIISSYELLTDNASIIASSKAPYLSCGTTNGKISNLTVSPKSLVNSFSFHSFNSLIPLPKTALKIFINDFSSLSSLSRIIATFFNTCFSSAILINGLNFSHISLNLLAPPAAIINKYLLSF